MFGRPENISVQMFCHSFGYHFKQKPIRVILAPKSRTGRDKNHPPNARIGSIQSVNHVFELKVGGIISYARDAI